MDKDEIQRRVTKVVCRILNVTEDMVEPQSHFVFDLGAESTQSIELVAAMEGEFGIEMDEDAALNVKTVDEAVDFLAKHVH